MLGVWKGCPSKIDPAGVLGLFLFQCCAQGLVFVPQSLMFGVTATILRVWLPLCQRTLQPGVSFFWQSTRHTNHKEMTSEEHFSLSEISFGNWFSHLGKGFVKFVFGAPEWVWENLPSSINHFTWCTMSILQSLSSHILVYNVQCSLLHPQATLKLQNSFCRCKACVWIWFEAIVSGHKCCNSSSMAIFTIAWWGVHWGACNGLEWLLQNSTDGLFWMQATKNSQKLNVHTLSQHGVLWVECHSKDKTWVTSLFQFTCPNEPMSKCANCGVCRRLDKIVHTLSGGKIAVDSAFGLLQSKGCLFKSSQEDSWLPNALEARNSEQLHSMARQPHWGDSLSMAWGSLSFLSNTLRKGATVSWLSRNCEWKAVESDAFLSEGCKWAAFLNTSCKSFFGWIFHFFKIVSSGLHLRTFGQSANSHTGKLHGMHKHSNKHLDSSECAKIFCACFSILRIWNSACLQQKTSEILKSAPRLKRCNFPKHAIQKKDFSLENRNR